MLILMHVSIALASLAWTSYLLFRPSRKGFTISYALIGSTLLSGTYLVIKSHAPMLSACTTGLLYLVTVSAGLAVAHHRLTKTSE